MRSPATAQADPAPAAAPGRVEAGGGYHVRGPVESGMRRVATRPGTRRRLRSESGRQAEAWTLVALLTREATLE